ncbi:MAG: hypothetical protein A2912_06165 [Candidatus Buchananbacteria bacterium RIFCSPLOWO2_01_FULL_40_23b]|uniref:Steroid 5-alpha reductase C-terminal domain-containing protein n=1 Tax=Candidatus Buchananbacteria bacterium RIFCSPLOWO2_01_FULL_40_23b TaxID=1797544 RepID=A0A1G1YT24_9BACT|nr:MAG: hypothetical protein A2912_06165 [Candidatus Buchananbacteria bacterium RIFCSPLOWO2_01_FULL_40_23b]
MNTDIIRVIIGFDLLLFLIVWIALTPNSLVSLIIKNRKPIRTPLLLVEILWFIQILNPSFLYSRILDIELVRIFGTVITTLSIIFAIWARLTMKKSWGVPAQHNIEKQNKLITTGPYQYSRNPIYLGIIGTFIGMAMAFSNFLFFLTPLLIWYFYEIIQREETLLQKYFGKEYLRYKNNVPRFLLV